MASSKNGSQTASRESLGQSAGKALDILDCFTSDTPELGVAEVAQMINATPSTASRLLATLESRGYVMRDRSSKYRLGLGALALAGVVAGQMELRNIAWPYIRDLADQSKCTANLAVRFRDKALFLVSIFAADSKDARGKDVPGRQLPLYCTAVGKVLLAGIDESTLEEEISGFKLIRRTANTITTPRQLIEELREVRTKGYALDREEEMLGSNCMAVPVRVDNAVGAAISVSGPVHRYPIGQIEQFLEILLNTSYHLSLSLSR